MHLPATTTFTCDLSVNTDFFFPSSTVIPCYISSQPKHLALFILPRSGLEMLLILWDIAKQLSFESTIWLGGVCRTLFSKVCFLWSCCFHVPTNKVGCINLPVVLSLSVCIIVLWIQIFFFKVLQTAGTSDLLPRLHLWLQRWGNFSVMGSCEVACIVQKLPPKMLSHHI